MILSPLERYREASPSVSELLVGLVAIVLLVVGLVVSPRLFVDNLIGGLVYGMILAMIALGLALILGLLGVVNFAHGALFLLGAYGTYQIVAIWEVSFWAALVVIPIAVGLVGIAIESGVLRFLYGENPLISLLATFGVSLMIEEVARAQWGATPLSFQTPAVLGGSLPLGITNVATIRLFTMAIGAFSVLAVYILIHRTDFGLTIRAGLQNQEMAEFIGINIPRRFTIVFFLGAVLAGLAGVLRGGEVGMDLGMGFHFVILAFVIVVVGGIGSIFGSVVSAILIGLSVFLAPVTTSALATITGIERLAVSGIGGIAPYIVLLVVLMLRPRGLFGEEGLME